MTTSRKILVAVVVLTIGVGVVLVLRHSSSFKSDVHAAPKGQIEFPRASWKFAGYADPESAYESMMWAMSQGNVDATLDSLTPAARAKWEGNMKKPKAEYGVQWAQRTKQTELFRVLDKQSVSDTEMHLQIESVGASNEDPVHQQWAKMIKVGSDWKFEGWVGN